MLGPNEDVDVPDGLVGAEDVPKNSEEIFLTM